MSYDYRTLPWSWVSLTQLQDSARQLAGMLPDDVDAIVGVPRSGLLVASTVATLLHLPLYEPARFGVRLLRHAGRLENACDIPVRRFAVLDDSVHTGGRVQKLRRSLRTVPAVFGAAIGTKHGAGLVDFCPRVIDPPHFFEWNLFNTLHVQHAAFDMDGILCCDPPEYLDADDARSAAWFERVPPLYPARAFPLACIITGRLERHRAVTERWLAKWGIRCDKLLMAPFANHHERNRRVIEWKAEMFAATGLPFMVESDAAQAEGIHRLARKPVLCPAAGKFFQHLAIEDAGQQPERPWHLLSAEERAYWRQRKHERWQAARRRR